MLNSFIDTVANLYKRNYDIILGTLVITLLVLIFEAFYIGWKKSSLRNILTFKSKSANTDLFLFFLAATKLDIIITFLLTLGLSRTLPAQVRKMIDFEPQIFIDHVWIHVIAYLIILDFLQYFSHYLKHQVPIFWEIHKMHHSASEFNGITSIRRHPFGTLIINSLILTIPMGLVGTPVSVILYIVLIKQVFAVIHHSRIDSDFGWVGKYILVSPNYHKIHHSTATDHHTKNLGANLILWDWIFKTKYDGNVAMSEYGIEDNPYNKNPIKDLLLSFKLIFNSIKKAILNIKI